MTRREAVLLLALLSCMAAMAALLVSYEPPVKETAPEPSREAAAAEHHRSCEICLYNECR